MRSLRNGWEITGLHFDRKQLSRERFSDHAPEDPARHADAQHARLPRLRIGIFRGSSSICLFYLGKRGTMQSRSSLIGVNVTSDPDLRDSCSTSTIRKYRRIHAAPRIGPMKSASVRRFANTILGCREQAIVQNEMIWRVFANHSRRLQKIPLVRRTMEAIGRAGFF